MRRRPPAADATGYRKGRDRPQTGRSARCARAACGNSIWRRSVRLMSAMNWLYRPAVRSLRMNQRSVRRPPVSVTTRRSSAGASQWHVARIRAARTCMVKRSQVAPSRWNSSSVSTCSELLRAPVSSLALSRPMPSCGNARRSRQPRVTTPAHVQIRHVDGESARWGSRGMERVKGIEPSSVAWEATALPLSYTRVGRRMVTRDRAGLESSRHTLAHERCRSFHGGAGEYRLRGKTSGEPRMARS